MTKKKVVKKRASVPRNYNANTMTESEMRNSIIAKLRMATRWFKPKVHCIRDSGGICAECGKKFLKKDLRADHFSPIVPTNGWKDTKHLVFGYNWNEWIGNAFIETGWQALCKECHSIKTKEENAERKRIKNLKLK